ncbi:MAG: hypothetical protein JXQ67_02140 [Campylobacterales bacterium]|nr:hypothetical protein [Campylobacterales bacterium]
MNEELDEQEKRENRFAEAIAEIAHSQLGYYIGVALFMFVILVLSKWDGHLFDRKGCVEVQEISGKFFKVDTCSGKVEELEAK